MRGTALLRELRQLAFLPLRRETIYHLVSSAQGAEQPSLNRLIAADPALAFALLRGCPRPYRESRLGIPQIAKFATAQRLVDLVRETESSAHGIDAFCGPILNQVWIHSIATAHAARHLSRSRRYDHPQTAYLAGLLHNLGLLAVGLLRPDVVAEVIAYCGRDADRWTDEKKRMGATHASIGSQLAKRWGLPQWLHDVMAWHHHPSERLPVDLADRGLVQLVCEADQLVSESEFGLGRAADTASWGLPWKNADALVASITRGVRQSTNLLLGQCESRDAEQRETLLARTVELVAENVALHGAYDWQHRSWEQFRRLPVGAAPLDFTALIAETFAHALGLLGVLCYVRSSDGGTAEGTFWCDGPRSMNGATVPGGAKSHTEQMVARLRPTWQQRPYRVIDLEVSGEALAHVVMWVDEFGPPLVDESLVQVQSLCTQWLAHASHAAQLEAQVESLTSALREQATDAELRLEQAKLEALAEMAAGAGHEINNPLAVISGRAQLLLAEETDPRRRRSLETIMAQAQRIHRMIVDLMYFARPPAPEQNVISVAEVVDRALQTIQRDADELRVSIVTAIPTDLRAVGDLAQLAAAIECILRNSLEATSEGGSIRVSAEASENSTLRICVTDRGTGISEEQRKHIFEPFYSGREAGRGLGMGLPKAWRIVQNHGGEIQIDSTPQGTTVTIQLRGAAAEAEQRACA